MQFRNLWVRETPDRPAPPDGYGDFDVAALSAAEMDGLVGRYDRGGGGADVFVIERTDDGLGLSMPWRTGVLSMIPLSATEFQLTNTAGTLTFDVDDAGNATGVTFEMGGGVYPATRIGE